MYTQSTSKADAVANRKWYIVDVDGAVLGRTATRIAHILRGKHKPTFTPHIDDGDYIVVLNAARIRLTGNKLADKKYWRHSGYPGGIHSTTAGELLETKPEEVLRKAVRGMLPRGPLGRAQLRKLKIFAGAEHTHGAQQPEALDLNTLLSASA